MKKRLPFVRYRLKESNWCTEKIDSFADMFRMGGLDSFLGDDIYEFQIVYMTQEEYDALPEFEGF